jgi:hypothetical protein
MNIEVVFQEKIQYMINKDNYNEMIESICYLIRMFWLGRLDKLNKNEFEFYLWLTNNYTDAPEIKIDDILFNKNVFPNENHNILSDDLISNLIKIRNNNIKKDSLWSKLKLFIN